MSNAANKRRKTTTGPVSTREDSIRLQLSKNIAVLTNAQEEFIEATKNLASFKEESLRAFDLQLEAKKSELEELERTFEITKKNKEIELDQSIKEYGYAAALKILEERKEIPIQSAELEKLRSLVASHEQTLQKQVEEATAKERVEGKRALEAAVKNCQLTHKAETAQLQAGAEQKQHEIESLRAQIKDYKHELERTRETIKDVAQASAKSVNQTFGKA